MQRAPAVGIAADWGKTIIGYFKAISNIGQELLFQFRLRGALPSRLLFICRYYWLYTRNRLRGETQGDSRMKALETLSRMPCSNRQVRVVWPDGLRTELDLPGASKLPMEFLDGRMYEQFPGFIPASGQTVVDVGAHQGCFSLRAARRVGPKGKVFSIEAHPQNAELLARNLNLNDIHNVELVRTAVSDANGEALFYTTALVSGGHSLVFKTEVGEQKREAMKVSTRTLDDILRGFGVERVDLLKIDVEGAFLAVLAGAPLTLASKPRIVMEVEGTRSNMDLVRRRLEPLGYRIQTRDSILYAKP